eukprot:TRINITY_DN6534_c0_g1_i1.p1 TRINITY_DN6534_c0_g1~~TRINITY_DN6534_c0_g1_i1.p1  ORF type:complete len:551 (+),score=176.62 TRINITY_DN6534_c0_g1_i1:74-1726(+)
MTMTAGVLELFNASPAAAVATLVACACLGLAVFHRLAPKGRDGLRRRRDVPGPLELPLIGHGFQLVHKGIDRIDKIVNDWATEYGDCYRLWLTGPGICVSDTPTMMHVLQHRPGTFSRERIAAEMVAQAGFRGLFPANGDVWKRYHRVMVPHFKRSNVKHMVAQVCRFATRLCRKWDAHAESRTAFNCMADLPLYALDNGFYFVLGRDVGALAEKPTGAARDAWIMMEALRKRLMTLVPPMRRDPAGKAAEDRIDVFIKGLMDDYRSSSRLSAGATSTTAAEDGAEVADGETEQQCLLQYVLRVADPAAGDTGRNALSEAEVLGNMKMFFFAGTHPVAAAAGWMLYYMALLPGVQTRVRTEVEGVIAAGTGVGVSPHVDGGDAFTWEQVEKLEYLDAVMQEALRLHHAAPVMLLEAERDVQVRDVLLRRGECVTLNLQRSGLLEENFTRASEFWPDRWLIAAGHQAAPADMGDLRHANVVGSFGLGARACPGQMLAKVLVKVAVSLIVRDFNVELAPGQGLPETTLSLANTPTALNLVLSKRPGPAAPRS